MKAAAWTCVVILLGVSIIPPVCASDGSASQPITEPGDPPAQYDQARRDWFVRQTTLAEPDGGSKSRLSVTFLENTQMLPINGPDAPAIGTWAQPLMDSLERFFVPLIRCSSHDEEFIPVKVLKSR